MHLFISLLVKCQRLVKLDTAGEEYTFSAYFKEYWYLL